MIYLIDSGATFMYEFIKTKKHFNCKKKFTFLLKHFQVAASECIFYFSYYLKEIQDDGHIFYISVLYLSKLLDE